MHVVVIGAGVLGPGPRRGCAAGAASVTLVDQYAPGNSLSSRHREWARTFSLAIIAAVIALGILGLMFPYGPWS